MFCLTLLSISDILYSLSSSVSSWVQFSRKIPPHELPGHGSEEDAAGGAEEHDVDHRIYGSHY